jgi:photosystem II stability/assembly factor-like uncharacterized protein
MMVRSLPGRVAGVAALLVIPILVGTAIAVVSSPKSLTSIGIAATPTARAESASPAVRSTPTPSLVLKAGILAGGPNLSSFGHGVLVAASGSAVLVSTDAGKTWATRNLPGASTGAVVDPSDPKHIVAGGSSIVVSTDGVNWTPTVKPPPGPPSYQPLLVSRLDPRIWFFAHGAQLLRTRDAGVSWTDIGSTQPPAISAVVPGVSVDQYFVVAGTNVLELANKTPAFTDLGAPAGTATVLQMAPTTGSPARLLVRGSNGGSYVLRPDGWHESGSKLGGPVAAAGVAMWVADGAGKAAAGAVELSGDGGITWSAGAGLPSNQSVDALAADPDGSQVYAYTYAGDVYASQDSGKTWALASSGLRAP